MDAGRGEHSTSILKQHGSQNFTEDVCFAPHPILALAPNTSVIVHQPDNAVWTADDQDVSTRTYTYLIISL